MYESSILSPTSIGRHSRSKVSDLTISYLHAIPDLLSSILEARIMFYLLLLVIKL